MKVAAKQGPALISLAEACRRAGISQQRAMRAMAAGQFPKAVLVGSGRMLGRREFEAWLEAACRGVAA